MLHVVYGCLNLASKMCSRRMMPPSPHFALFLNSVFSFDSYCHLVNQSCQSTWVSHNACVLFNQSCQEPSVCIAMVNNPTPQTQGKACLAVTYSTAFVGVGSLFPSSVVEGNIVLGKCVESAILAKDREESPIALMDVPAAAMGRSMIIGSSGERVLTKNVDEEVAGEIKNVVGNSGAVSQVIWFHCIGIGIAR